MKKLLLMSLLLLFLAGSAQAYVTIVKDYPELPACKNNTKCRPGEGDFGLPEYVKYIFIFALGAVGVIGMLALILAAFSYVMSTGNPQKAAVAKDQIISALLGLLLLLASWVLLNFINPDLLKLGLNVESVTTEKRFGCFCDNLTEFKGCFPESTCGQSCKNACGNKTSQCLANAEQCQESKSWCCCETTQDNLKCTKTENEDICKGACTSNNPSAYCPGGAQVDETDVGNIYCADISEVSTKQVACLVEAEEYEDLADGTCYNWPACQAAIEGEFRNECYEDGTLQCQCLTQAPGQDPICAEDGVPYATSPYTLFKYTPDAWTFNGCYNARICSEKLGSSCNWCRVNYSGCQ